MMHKRCLTLLTVFCLLLNLYWLPSPTVHGEEIAAADVADAGTETEGALGGGDIDTTKPEGESEGAIVPEEPEEPVVPEAEPLLIEELMLDDSKQALFLPLATCPTTLTAPETAWAMYERFRGVECSIAWRYEELDQFTPGRQLLTGDILLPDGYAFAADPLLAQVPVIVYDPEGEPTEIIASCIYGEPLPVIPLGTDREALLTYFADLTEEAYFTTEQGDEFSCQITLDLDAIDTDEVGVYFPLLLDLPGGVAFAENKPFLVGAYVLPSDVMCLNALQYFMDAYLMRWLAPVQEPILWVAIDDSLPQSLLHTEINGNYYHDYGLFSYNAELQGFDGLEIFFTTLTPGHFYQFRVQYGAGDLSNTLEIDLINNALPTITNSMGGDRNWGDREENPPPPTTPPPGTGDYDPPPSPQPDAGGTKPEQPPTEVEQPEPTPELPPEPLPPPSEPTAPPAETEENEVPVADGEAENESVAAEIPSAPTTTQPLLTDRQPTTRPPEYSSERCLAVSGSRLATMIKANPTYVSFIRGTLQAAVPTSCLQELNLRPDDVLTVTLYQPDEASFTVGFTVNGEVLLEEVAEPFFVRLPWYEGPVSCLAEGLPVVAAFLDPRTHTATFALQHSGTFKLVAAADSACLQSVSEPEAMGFADSLQTKAVNSITAGERPSHWRNAILIALPLLTALVVFTKRQQRRQV